MNGQCDRQAGHRTDCPACYYTYCNMEKWLKVARNIYIRSTGDRGAVAVVNTIEEEYAGGIEQFIKDHECGTQFVDMRKVYRKSRNV